jgi:hypothetical protein
VYGWACLRVCVCVCVCVCAAGVESVAYVYEDVSECRCVRCRPMSVYVDVWGCDERQTVSEWVQTRVSLSQSELT